MFINDTILAGNSVELLRFTVELEDDKLRGVIDLLE
jgi:hypothetical protein